MKTEDLPHPVPVPGKKQEAKGENTMQRFITDERTGIRYELIGDYYYPCLTVEESPPLSHLVPVPGKKV